MNGFAQELLTDIRGNRAIIMVAIPLLLAWLNAGYLKGLLPWAQSAIAWLTTPRDAATRRETPPTVPVLSEKQLDFAALERLQKSAEARACPECKAAVQAYLSHMFDDKSAVVTFTTSAVGK